jgi:hypothetical protein
MHWRLSFEFRLYRRCDQQFFFSGTFFFETKTMNLELKAALDVIEDQKAQLRLIVDAYSSQINWAKQWKVLCHENMRLQAQLKAKDDGTEVLDLRRQLVDKTMELAQAQAGFHQRGILLRGALNEVWMLTAENERLRQQQP